MIKFTDDYIEKKSEEIFPEYTDDGGMTHLNSYYEEQQDGFYRGVKWVQENYIITNLDYKELLRKYIEHVDDREGSNFISHNHFKKSSVKFSDKEIEELKELAK